MDLHNVTIGVIGLGQMGGGIAENLADADYRCWGLIPSRLRRRG
ncbi:MAG: hypothetical protein J7M39_04175 [Anaerolineae bacterium]|nr:hypothetical protein [Anaerolineae bacterium]